VEKEKTFSGGSSFHSGKKWDELSALVAKYIEAVRNAR
jgi:hypothetical protein